MNKVTEFLTQLGGTSVELLGSKEKGRLAAFANDLNGYTIEVFWESSDR